MTLLHNIIIYYLYVIYSFGTLQNPTDVPYQRIMRAAHVIKGASANLMCAQLRATAMALEQAANQCHEQGGKAAPAPVQAAVQTAYADLKQAAQNYVAYLTGIGV
jgi:HPt (histidine-containing phosphotransfer) domain-containing protein